MSPEQSEQKPPLVVKGEKHNQAGCDILVASCPHCQRPVAASGPGKIRCQCETYLQLEEASP